MTKCWGAEDELQIHPQDLFQIPTRDSPNLPSKFSHIILRARLAENKNALCRLLCIDIKNVRFQNSRAAHCGNIRTLRAYLILPNEMGDAYLHIRVITNIATETTFPLTLHFHRVTPKSKYFSYF